ncbi:MAG TPA: hypothetical protein VF278_21550 [Pirellulales bacterium]
MREGAVFPPVIVVYDQKDYWLADGFHRLHARLQLPSEQPTIDCQVHEGSLRDAILLAVQANATHGLRRTNQDKRRAVETILADEEWSQKSTRWVAKTCGVGQGLVEDVRRQLPDSGSWPEGGCFSGRLGQDGKRRAAPNDAAGALPADLIVAALSCASAFDLVLAHVRRVQTEGERLAAGPGGRFLSAMRLDEFRSHLAEAADALAATRPTRRCKYCRGDGCEMCRDAGWTCPDLD